MKISGGKKGPRLDFQACVTFMYPKQTLVPLWMAFSLLLLNCLVSIVLKHVKGDFSIMLF